MTGTELIDEPPRARNTDPETSHDAAEAVNLNRLQNAILGFLDGAGFRGATCGEMAQALGIPRDSLSPRMRTLEAYHLVIETAIRRKLPGGRPQIVWLAIKNNPHFDRTWHEPDSDLRD
jgi:predicted ArsR family transcriptional regulator